MLKIEDLILGEIYECILSSRVGNSNKDKYYSRWNGENFYNSPYLLKYSNDTHYTFTKTGNLDIRNNVSFCGYEKLLDEEIIRIFEEKEIANNIKSIKPKPDFSTVDNYEI